MRISDWSSDVCSSDLLGALHAGGMQPYPECRPRRSDGNRRECAVRRDDAQGYGRDPQHLPRDAAPLPAGRLLPPRSDLPDADARQARSEEHTSELQSLMRISYAVFCLKKKNKL